MRPRKGAPAKVQGNSVHQNARVAHQYFYAVRGACRRPPHLHLERRQAKEALRMRSWGSAFDRMIAYVIAAVAVLGLVGLGAYDLLGTHGSASPAAAGTTSNSVTSTTVDPATT